jgi:uncharacterized membrane protein
VPGARRRARGVTARLESDLQRAEQDTPAWLRTTQAENRIPVALAILAAVGLQLSLPSRYGLHPRWLLPALELMLLVVLIAINPLRLDRATRIGSVLSRTLVAIITVDNVVSSVLLDHAILTSATGDDPGALLARGATIYLTNIIAFGIWYWELDRGGPFARAAGSRPHPDFLFPQMTSPDVTPKDWEPRFVDYLYVSFTNVVAFSPTDTMPLTRWAKGLMALQSIVALSTTALVIARAVNILK